MVSVPNIILLKGCTDDIVVELIFFKTAFVVNQSFKMPDPVNPACWCHSSVKFYSELTCFAETNGDLNWYKTVS